MFSSSSHPFNYYPPSEFFFNWNNNSSLMRTQSASFQHYPQSGNIVLLLMRNKSYWPYLQLDQHCLFCLFILASFPRFNSIKSTTNPYPSFWNNIPEVNLPFVPPPPLPPPVSQSSSTISAQAKRSIPSNRKRPRLSSQLRNEILQLRANRPTIFIWEMQQYLIENGICTPQTVPHVNPSISPWKKINLHLSRRPSFNEFSPNRSRKFLNRISIQ